MGDQHAVRTSPDPKRLRRLFLNVSGVAAVAPGQHVLFTLGNLDFDLNWFIYVAVIVAFTGLKLLGAGRLACTAGGGGERADRDGLGLDTGLNQFDSARMRTLTHRLRLSVLGAATVALFLPALTGHTPTAAAATTAASDPVQVYGAWLCGSDQCTWAAAPDMTTFDTQNHWLVDRGNGSLSVNLVVLSFADPLKLLDGTNDAGDTNGVPNGMDQAVVSYFTSHGVRVMISIGGVTYTNDWDSALTQNATLLGQKAAALATQLGVGIEIDYENSASPNLTGMQSFINAYRAVHPYDATGANPAARLTIDLAAGDRYLISLDQYATANWLSTANPVLDYANAMVPNKQPSASSAEGNWLQHVDGEPQYSPPIAPLAPAKFTGSVYVAGQSQVLPECNNFASSLQSSTSSWEQSVAPAGAGSTNGMLGFMFWAAGAPSTRGQTTFPPNSCTGGVGVGATSLNVPVPMPALRQN